MLYKDFKLSVLKKIDPAISNINETRTTRDYLNSFVGAANRGLQDLATTGKYIIKSYCITQRQVRNILASPNDNMDIVTHYKEDISYTAPATSYYFEVAGTADISFVIDGVEVLGIAHRPIDKKKFVAFKGFINNPDLKPVKLTFGGRFPYDVWNVAMYDQAFENEEDIWEFVSEKRYDLRKLIPDFYKLSESDVVFQNGISDVRYQKTKDYYFEGSSTLVLNGLQRGSWTIHYFAYPPPLTEMTAADYNIELDPEVLELLIVFTASELVYDDDRSTSGAWRNHYEAGKQLLSPTSEHSKSKFIDMQGW